RRVVRHQVDHAVTVNVDVIEPTVGPRPLCRGEAVTPGSEIRNEGNHGRSAVVAFRVGEAFGEIHVGALQVSPNSRRAVEGIGKTVAVYVREPAIVRERRGCSLLMLRPTELISLHPSPRPMLWVSRK